MRRFTAIISLLFICITTIVFVGTAFAQQHHTAAVTRAGNCVAISASPDYLSSESAHDAIAAINHARQYERLPNLHLPSDFYSMPAIRQQFVLVNLERTDRGLQPLQMDTNLSQIALAYSKQLHDLNFFSHTSPISGTFSQRINSNPFIAGHYHLAAENLAGNPVAGIGPIYEYMYNDISEACGHRQNILDPNLHLIGIGLVSSSIYGSISAQEFLASASWNPYRGVQARLVAPQISIKIDNYVQHDFILCEANMHSSVGNARITWFLDHTQTVGQVGIYWGLDLHHLSAGKHTLYAYAVDGMQSYALATYTFQI